MFIFFLKHANVYTEKKIFHALRIIYHSVAIKIQYLNTGVVFKNVYLVGHPSSKILRESLNKLNC